MSPHYHNYNLYFFYVIFVLLEDQGLPEEVFLNKKKKEKNVYAIFVHYFSSYWQGHIVTGMDETGSMWIFRCVYYFMNVRGETILDEN